MSLSVHIELAHELQLVQDCFISRFFAISECLFGSSFSLRDTKSSSNVLLDEGDNRYNCYHHQHEWLQTIWRRCSTRRNSGRGRRSARSEGTVAVRGKRWRANFFWRRVYGCANGLLRWWRRADRVHGSRETVTPNLRTSTFARFLISDVTCNRWYRGVGEPWTAEWEAVVLEVEVVECRNFQQWDGHCASELVLL